MSRSSWHRVVAAVLVAAACSLTLPAKSEATALSMDSGISVGKLLNRAWDWLVSLVPPVGGDRHNPGDAKFGAGQSSDGHTSRRAAY